MQSEEGGQAVDPISAGVTKVAVDAVAATGREGGKAVGNLLERLLGPLADEVGGALLEKYRSRNVKNVVARAERKAKLDEEGAIPPRLAAAVFDQAQWADEEFVAEYLSGVLASARTPTGINDRGVGWSALVSRLSSEELKLHYAIYSSVREYLVPKGMDPTALAGHTASAYFMSYDSASAFVEFASEESFQEALYGLSSENLLTFASHGYGAFLTQTHHKVIEDSGVVFQPTARGALLYLEALGLGGEWFGVLADPSFELPTINDVALASGPPLSVSVGDLPDA